MGNFLRRLETINSRADPSNSEQVAYIRLELLDATVTGKLSRSVDHPLLCRAAHSFQQILACTFRIPPPSLSHPLTNDISGL